MAVRIVEKGGPLRSFEIVRNILAYEAKTIPRQSDRATIGKQLMRMLELSILDSESSSLSDNDLEIIDLLSTDSEIGDSSSDSDHDGDLMEDSNSDHEDTIGDLTAFMEVVEQSRYLSRSDRWDKSS
ncbi:hypothetical protein R1sor_000710 [Riccia sorocarpa]|uniref:Uncharacterized protein n=1 Tax=Riccia sorocarpa TaxID=122646 RepID=A0ABD3GUQ7_9MARC